MGSHSKTGPQSVRRVMVTFAILSLLVGACGTDTPESEPDAGTQGSDTQVAGEPYTVGYIADLSGPLRDSYSPTLEGFELYMEALNASGGIDSHPVEVVARDDELSADEAVSAAVDLATQENVSGIFGLSLSSTHQPVYETMAAEGIPVVTGFSGVEAALPPAQNYAYSAGTIFEIAGEAAGDLMTRVVDGGVHVCVTFESVGGLAACDHQEAAAAAAGFESERVVFPVAERDFTAVGEDIASRDPDIVTGHYGSEQNVGMIGALRDAGYDGPYLIANYGVTEDAIRRGMDAAGSDQNIFVFGRWAMVDEDEPAVRKLANAAEEYGTDFPLSNAHVSGWGLGQVAQAALEQCGFPCSPEGLNTALQDLEVDTNGATGGPIRFTSDDHYGDSFWRLYEYAPEEDVFDPVGEWLELSSELTYDG